MTCDVEKKKKKKVKRKRKKKEKNDPDPDPAFYWHPFLWDKPSLLGHVKSDLK